ncbi:MAG: 50S ribosome-binding GTPase [Syntrophales bacterium]|nr:50S ribosome-binding GTPase [Syntrophales bacterium]
MKREASLMSQDMMELENLLIGDIPLLFVPTQERRELGEILAGTRKKLESMGDNILTIGIIGGTGVGKSTVMNALARENIASTSHRRPHTDSVLVYRHVEVSIPELFEKTPLPWREYAHEASEARHVVLCDLPDYDSIEGTHREMVVNFLDAMDMLIWVLSPEKYADGRFYDFLRDLPKDRRNCYFVVNKADLFFEDGLSPIGKEHLMKVMDSLEGHLKNSGIEDPVMYHISAEQSLEGNDREPWNQFAMLKREIMRTREIKEVKRIKAANIDAELEPVFRALERERQILEGIRGMIRAGSSMSDKERGRAIDELSLRSAPWIEAMMNHSLASRLAVGEDLVGPGRIIAALAGRFRGVVAGEPEKIAALRSRATADLSASIARYLEVREERIKADLYRRLALSSIPEEIYPSTSADSAVAGFESGLAGIFSDAGRSPSVGPSRIFRYYQYLIYGFLVLVFFLVLPGEDAWKAFFAEPGFFSGLRTAALIVVSFFTPRGLAAMGSLILISCFLGWRFNNRFRKIIAAWERSFMENMKDEVSRLAMEAIDSWGKEMERLDHDIQSRLSSVTAFFQKRRNVA